ncbi:molybdopterin-guanine dinucleotide biosynthesis protein B [Thiofilum flexile]|uniref:molybdopterin-guanine dinucleotide biosynthesis protein B n=1 Tax=Thiofilum flexile TaxID=125627 RepID=UPI00036CE724|nr:molybdopterin-guanine dinucleotide biosynthesis protein B [Thiofilum flexile]
MTLSISNYFCPVVGFCAYSGTGKTTLLTQLIPLIKAKGIRVAIIKHAHHQLELDQPGKDSYRMREAGADQVLLMSAKVCALTWQGDTAPEEASLTRALSMLTPHSVDLVIVEGFKHESYPKIEIHRPALGNPLLHLTDPDMIAVVSDEMIESILPVLDLNQPEQIVEFVMDYFGLAEKASSNWVSKSNK